MKLRYVFSEMPYAMALTDAFRRQCCSFCAADTSKTESGFQCDRGCHFVVYCNEACRKNDRPFHEAECKAIRCRRKLIYPDSIGLSVRLMGRVISRYNWDKGVARLSINFPEDTSEHRNFNDLMTHERELRHSREHTDSFKDTKNVFYDFFRDTRLGDTSEKLLWKFYCRLAINGFSLSVRLKPEPDAGEELGEVIYLDASRFNHSCRPSCLYKFEGARIVIEYIESGDNPEKKWTKAEFENLTLQYGYGSFWNNGSTCPLTEQRIESLKYRYFFRCRCVLCDDRNLDRVQHDASPVECSKCQNPYVWHRRWFFFGKMKLKKLCKCKIEDKSAVSFGKRSSRDAKTLGREWKKAMRDSEKAGSYEVLKLFEPVSRLADQCWHRCYNLRLGHVYEKLFLALCEMTVQDDEWSKFAGTEDDLDKLLKTGEAMMAVYMSYFEPFMITITQYACQLAILYKLRENNPEAAERSNFWFNFAINHWKDRGDTECVQAIEEKARAPPPEWTETVATVPWE